jgi:FKBP-type peptidyl-prolyl cis-trans isomerase (trigger factor)
MIGEKLTASLDELDADLNTNRAKKQYFNLSQPQNCSDEAELEIVEIKRVKKRELNADFFKDVLQDQSIEDYNLFRDKLRNAISDSFSSPAYNIYNRSIFEHLMEQNIELPLPKTFLKRFVEETQMKGKAIQDAQFSELIKQLTWGTITNELCKKHNINVSAEDVEYEMRMAIVRYYGIQISPFHNLFDNQVKKMMEDKETYRKYFEEVQESKLFAELEEQFNKEQKSVSVKEFKEIYDQYFVKQQEKEEAEAEQLDAILDSEEA